jgi:hypothetical protein
MSKSKIVFIGLLQCRRHVSIVPEHITGVAGRRVKVGSITTTPTHAGGLSMNKMRYFLR